MARLIAFYLPQFHPIEENNRWWGPGFTEWTNVAKARPLFRGHYQPHIPADLGFYDLRLPETREAQARLAREAGIEGFCYWHYWLGDGRQLLQRPFQEVLASGRPDYPFCLGWANHSWSSKTWTKNKSLQRESMLMEQRYSVEDYERHFYHVLPALRDKRYILVEGKPLFFVFAPKSIPDAREFIALWQRLARENGLPGIYFVGHAHNASFWKVGQDGRRRFSLKPDLDNPAHFYREVLDMGFDAVNSSGLHRASMIVGSSWKRTLSIALFKYFNIGLLRKFNHERIVENLYCDADRQENIFPTVIPNWDRSPRAGKQDFIAVNSTPEVFEKNLRLALDLVRGRDEEKQIIFLQSWNEWGEGNHVEPDERYGHGYLEAIKKHFKK